MVATGNVGVAFALVLGAGLATTVGACIVFCVKLATPRLLASSLGFSAGVMVYICFGEIYTKKSVNAFKGMGYTDAEAFRYSTLCFFGGMAAIAILDQFVHFLTHHSDAVARLLASPVRAMARSLSRRTLLRRQRPRCSTAGGGGGGSSGGSGSGKGGKAPGGRESQQEQQQQEEEEEEGDGGSTRSSGDDQGGPALGDLESGCCSCCGCPPEEAAESATDAKGAPRQGAGCCGDSNGERRGQEEAVGVPEGAAEVLEVLQKDPHAFELQKMGVLTALAMGIHNFPEGLATFVGALSDVKVGAGIATAIAIHNIPEGICVAMPIYYATGNKWKAFLWAAVPGLLEPFGGLIGYLALHGDNDLAFAIVFGLVAGMMVFISIHELIPAAFKYDPGNTYTSLAITAGMAIMAASLLLFQI